MTPARTHLSTLVQALDALDAERIEAWGHQLADVLVGGGRLLVAGNGGSAAQAQHLTSELVGRYLHDRPPLSAIALVADMSSVSAIANDYGYEQAFARQIGAHGRPGDVFLGLSTSGRSPNLLTAADAAHHGGLDVWALSGPAPNPLAERADEVLAVDAAATATIQEVHQVVIHLLCAAVDARLGVAERSAVRLP